MTECDRRQVLLGGATAAMVAGIPAQSRAAARGGGQAAADPAVSKHAFFDGVVRPGVDGRRRASPGHSF